jgi:hypothetical protein
MVLKRAILQKPGLRLKGKNTIGTAERETGPRQL